jgi:hypothetical protein
MPCGVRLHIAAATTLLLSACATLPPAQEAGLKKAQQIADATTKLYGIGRIRVFADDRLPAGVGAGYYGQSSRILIRPEMLVYDRHLTALVAHELGHATLGYGTLEGWTPGERRRALAQQELEADRRSVEILVRVMGLTERDAIDSVAAYFVEANRARGGYALGVPADYEHPCEQLRKFWSSYLLSDPPPRCEVNTSPFRRKTP